MTASVTNSSIITPDPTVLKLDNGTIIKLDSSKSSRGDFDSIPIIDLEKMYSDNYDDRLALSKELFDACSNVGFFYAKNHGIPEDIVDNTFNWSKKFFHEQTTDEKMKVFTGLLEDENYQGYHPFGKFTFDAGNRRQPDLMEAFNFTYEREQDPAQPPPSDDCVAFENIWPENFPGFKENMFKYHTECLKIARKLIRILALSLGLEEDYFDKYVTYPAASMRILHYPVQEHSEDDQNGIGAHTDFEIFTMVNTGDVSGLQVLNKSGKWIQAPPISGCLVVNIADCLMRMTNNTFVSTVHRVVNNSGDKRYSIPFFFGFNQSMMMDPIPTCVSEANPYRYKVKSIKEYLVFRAITSKKKKEKGYGY